ncbi:MAG: hypothetical protein EU549_05300 [Promethearchaeota archaeon]|nr:MAG: hypothetical protein EU549_05300 [Candidatus Lokiarchaeota archaeon]
MFFATTQYPGYIIGFQFMSELGVGPGLSSPLFNIGLLMIGINLSDLSYNFIRFLRKENSNIHFIRFNMVFSILGGFSLALVGFFPQISFLMGIIHFIVACSFFINFPILIIGISILMLKSKQFNKFQSSFGFFVWIPFVIFLVTGFPLIEWIAVFILITWVIIVLFPFVFNWLKLIIIL